MCLLLVTKRSWWKERRQVRYTHTFEIFACPILLVRLKSIAITIALFFFFLFISQLPGWLIISSHRVASADIALIWYSLLQMLYFPYGTCSSWCAGHWHGRCSSRWCYSTSTIFHYMHIELQTKDWSGVGWNEAFATCHPDKRNCFIEASCDVSLLSNAIKFNSIWSYLILSRSDPIWSLCTFS